MRRILTCFSFFYLCTTAVSAPKNSWYVSITAEEKFAQKKQVMAFQSGKGIGLTLLNEHPLQTTERLDGCAMLAFKNPDGTMLLFVQRKEPAKMVGVLVDNQI